MAETIETREKAWYEKKLNWVGIGLLAVGILSDPEFTKFMGTFVPESVLPRVMSASGFLVFVLRTFFNSNIVITKKTE